MLATPMLGLSTTVSVVDQAGWRVREGRGRDRDRDPRRRGATLAQKLPRVAMVPLVLAALQLGMPAQAFRQGQETISCGGSSGESTTHSYEVAHELLEDQSSCRAESRPCSSDAFHQILLVVADPGNGRNYRVRMNNCRSEAEDTELCVNTEYGSAAT